MNTNISQTQNRIIEWTVQTDLPQDLAKQRVENNASNQSNLQNNTQVIPTHYASWQVWLTDKFFNLGNLFYQLLTDVGEFFLKDENDNKASRFKFFGFCFLVLFSLKHGSNFKFGALFPLLTQTDKVEKVEVEKKLPAKKISMDLSGTNIYAPVSANSLEEEKVIKFIQKYAPVAVKEMETYNIPASIKMAQALIESRAGRSKLAVNNNNHFGMKCFSRRCNKNHCTNATDDHHKDFFRKFDSPAASWKEHSKLISQGRYKSLQNHKLDYKKWAVGLKKAGYATDKKYATKLINIIEKYQLQQLDKLTS